MDDSRDAQAQRLKALREKRYATATAAARAIGVKPTTYANHENGHAGMTRNAERYARFFRVSLDYLLTGRGAPAPPEPLAAGSAPKRVRIAVRGLVGAGEAVEMIGDPPERNLPGHVEMPGDGEIAALVVRGDSMRPRFRDGEIVLFDPRPAVERELVDQIAIVQTIDGRRLIKTLRRGVGEGRWRLDSDNADPEEDVRLIGAWRYLGCLPATDATKRPEGIMRAARPEPRRARRSATRGG